MIFVSIDTETTGLDPETCQLLQLGMVIEDTSQDVPVGDLPTFDGIVRREVYQGEPYALSMHASLLKTLATQDGLNGLRSDGVVIESEAWVMDAARSWLQRHLGSPPYVAAGKNLGSFDFHFLPKSFTSLFHHRLIDAGSAALAFQPDRWREDTPPSLRDITGRSVAHTAVEDALDVIRFLRTTYKHERTRHPMTANEVLRLVRSRLPTDAHAHAVIEDVQRLVNAWATLPPIEMVTTGDSITELGCEAASDLGGEKP